MAKKQDYAGIGTLNERSLHAFLKNYLEPDTRFHEVPAGRYTADIRNAQGITEIQTRGFSSFKRKLSTLLKEQPVTVVYPVPEVKYLIWVDPETGDTTKPRKSPKKGGIYDICNELIHISDLLGCENLTFCLLFMEITDIRSLSGWSRDRKKGSERIDRQPGEVLGRVYIRCREDYRLFLPAGLPSPFKVKDFAAFAHITARLAGKVLYVLTAAGIIRRAGKERNAYLYETTES